LSREAASSPLTDAVRQRIELLFRPQEQEQVARLLEEHCRYDVLYRNSPASEVERVRFAILKLSHGEVARIQMGIDAARQDFRDVLMWADFGEPGMHLRWFPEKKW
jgi:hypothetical protein